MQLAFRLLIVIGNPQLSRNLQYYGKILLMDPREALTRFYYGVEGMFVFSQQMSLYLGGFRNAVFDMPKTKIGKLRKRFQRLMLIPQQPQPQQHDFNYWSSLQIFAYWLSIIWMLHKGVSATQYWAFVTFPPLLHPVTWDEPIDIPVYTNDTSFLGPEDLSHLVRFSVPYNYSGLFDSTTQPICFSKNTTNGCIMVTQLARNDFQNYNGIHWSAQMLYPNFSVTYLAHFPANIPLCNRRRISTSLPDWKLCHACNLTCNNVTNLCDWRPSQRLTGLYQGIWTMNNITLFTQIWKAVGAMDKAVFRAANITWQPSLSGITMHQITNNTEIWFQACVPEPYVFLSGSTLIINTTDHSVNCTNCVLSNCVNSSILNFVMLKQPPYVFLPVNLTHDWYADEGSEVLTIVTQALMRQKRIVGMIIAGVLAIITAISVTTMAAISLTTSIQTAQYINNISETMIDTLKEQALWDDKIERKLNALYDTVNLMGQEIQALAIKESLSCHAAYKAICVTPVHWNQSCYDWPKIQKHLSGIWNNANSSINLKQLHGEILSLQNIERLQLPLAQRAHDFVSVLKASFPSLSSFYKGIYCLIGATLCIIVLVIVLPCIFRLMYDMIKQTSIKTKKLQLMATQHVPATIHTE
ncbi:endogenous retrovirus group K member 25 Env polyprotein-like [Colius striatus]|uniref:endogenous retrovirus group K member 25 Env polyprotein-like n=1 Tax=Colius striatus TaxID=57412 RepID=UPI002B1D2216|nr:endogenous retrovirus group K member 25 Env polyprotein-like [Colius striatus]